MNTPLLLVQLTIVLLAVVQVRLAAQAMKQERRLAALERAGSMVGRCGACAPKIPFQPAVSAETFCVLPGDHAGWHRGPALDGPVMEWSRAAA